MTYTNPHTFRRGILAVLANGGTDIPTLISTLSADIQGFKTKQKDEVKELRASIDHANSTIAALTLNGVPDGRGSSAPVGNMSDERTALAEFSRLGDIRADLSIGGTAPGDASKGGAAVFPAVSNRIMVRQFNQSAIARLARRVTIEAGDRFEEPQDLGEPGAAWVGEKEPRPALSSAQFALLTVPVDEVYSSQRITQRLLDDSQYPLGDWLSERIADKLGRAAGEAFMSGDGDKKPLGISSYPLASEADTDRPWGTIQALYTGTAGGFGAAGADVLVDAVYALRSHYRPNARWIMNSKTAGAIRKMKDADGRFIWLDALAQGQPALLMGYPVEIDEYAPDIGDDAPAIWFGDIAQAYIIVDKPGLRLLRDPYTDKPNVIFYAYSRVGGRLQNSEAIKGIVFGLDPELP